MTRTLVIAALALTASSISAGQKESANTDQRSSVKQAIRQLDNERIQAQIGADAVALNRIYADDFIGVGPSGTVRTKPQVISDFTSGDLKFQSITTDEVQVRLYENTAVETGLSTMAGQDKGKAVPPRHSVYQGMGEAARALAVGCQPLLGTGYAVKSRASE
jgi:hypothetical protein